MARARQTSRWAIMSMFALVVSSHSFLCPALGSLALDPGSVSLDASDGTAGAPRAAGAMRVNQSAMSSSSPSCRSCPENRKRYVDWLREIETQCKLRHRQASPKVGWLQHKFFDSNLTTSFVVVDQDGNGDHASVQEAIDAVPVNNTVPITIFVSPGVYQEKVKIVESKPYITLQGSGADLTTIVWDDYAGKLGVDGSHLGTFHTATVHVSAPYFSARGITFKNSAPVQPAGSQAVAFQITGDMAAFYECNFIGAQDTLYDHSGRHYFKSCFIQGSVDFIFGNGRSLYKDCELNAIGSGALTAQKRQNASDNTGFSFVNCRILGNGLVYLGRAWGPFSRVVFLYCYMDSVINPGGWDDWGDSSRDMTVFYGEFNCTGPGANGMRRVPWSYVLTEAEAQPFLDERFIEGDAWLQYL
ncbi:probable pectinesterase 53 [Selaginella moellendorffii]|nr:probable pectinesterase 53 [Selaginella moellendorffii]|eukprot:XP_002968924.2 probable pectinesterase 53 [Selaginella moellendorffii]